MRTNSSQSKLLGSSSAGKNSRAQNQKELRQAQRQLNHYSALQQETDFTYAQSSAPRTVKNSTRTSIATVDVANAQPAGPSSSQTPHGIAPKSNLQIARAKIMNQNVNQQSNLFGGLSRHVINASSTAQQQAKSLGINAQGSSHGRGAGSIGHVYAKNQSNQFLTTQPVQQIQRHTSQHNVAYQTVPSSPNVNHIQQPCGRTLAALENMNQSQQKLRKSESQNVQFKQLSTVPGSLMASYSSSAQPSAQKASGSNSQKLKRILNTDKTNQNNARGQKGGSSSKQQYMVKKNRSINDEREELDDFQTRSLTAIQHMQPSPVPHQQFLSPKTENESMYSTQTFAKRTSMIQQQVAQDHRVINMYDSQNPSKLTSQHNSYLISDHQMLDKAQHERTGSFAKEESLSQSAFVERTTTPELTTPEIMTNQRKMNGGQNAIQMILAKRPTMTDKAIGVHVCCHEQAKTHAVTQQKIQFLTEQLKEEQSQAKMKEQQFNKMISALKKTAEENATRRQPAQSEIKSSNLNASQKEMQETYADLNSKKEEVNKLQEKVLQQELQAEKAALEFKIQLQQKNDEISEERLKFKHKESDLRNANSQIERLNEDLQNKIQEALDRQSDRLANEKQQDIESMNRRNEQLIKQLVDNHSIETRQLRTLLLEQERKCRETEHTVGNLEIELRTAKMDNDGRLDASEMEEIAAQNQHVNEIRLQTMQNQFTEENQQLRDVIVQLEQHINQIQESKSEADRKLIISEDKINEVKKEIARNKILVASQKEKEEKMQSTFKAQIAKERKTADVAVNKMKGVQKLEQDVNKKQILINQLRAKILEMEREEMHKSKILLMKRRQIEDEKTVLIKKQALRQRSMTRSNLSATRLQQKVDTQQAVIQTERDSKKALLQEKSKLQKEIVSIKRDKVTNNGGDSSRHNESMSMYFARSQGVFSPRTRHEQSTKSFIAANKGSKTSRHQVFMSQQTMDRNQLYLSKQFSHERTSSVGEGSLQGGDSMVNIVEFEENVSPTSRGRLLQNHSILSTPFKHDEPNESKITNLNFKTKAAYSQSVLAQHKDVKTDSRDNEVIPSDKILPIAGAGVAQFHTHGNMIREDMMKHFKTGQGKKIEQIQDQEEEFIQVLSGCDTSNDSDVNVKNKQMLRSLDKNPGMQMARKNNYMSAQAQQQTTTMINTNSANVASASKGAKPERKELQEIKLIQGSSSTQSKVPARTKNPNSSSFGGKNALGQKGSPNKMHLNMASMLTEQRLMDSKESFVRTVLTARQECEQFNETIRQKDEHALTTRNHHIPGGQGNGKGLEYTETGDFNKNGVQLQSNSFDEQQANNTMVVTSSVRNGPATHANIRQLNRNKTQQQFATQAAVQIKKRSPISRTPLNYSNDAKEMIEQSEKINEERKGDNDQTPEAPNEHDLQMKMEKINSNPTPAKVADDSSFNGLILQQLVNMTSSIDNGSHREDVSQHSNKLAEENNVLKEQLNLVKRSLAIHQEKAASTEMTMMDAIMQMKEQINQVITHKQMTNPEEDDRMTRTQGRMRQSIKSAKKHEDYLVMSRVSRNSMEEDQNHTAQKSKKVRAKLPQDQSATDAQQLRKTNSLHLRQRSETFDLTQAQAESMYKKIKIKSPNKRAVQGSISGGLQPSASAQGNFYKQTASSAMKRNSQQAQLMTKNPSNVSSFNNQQTNQQFVQQRDLPMNSNSFYTNQTAAMSQRLSVGVLKQSATQSVRKMSSANKASAQKLNQQLQQ